MNVMKNRWPIKNSPHAVRTLDDLTRIKGPAKQSLDGAPSRVSKVGWANRPGQKAHRMGRPRVQSIREWPRTGPRSGRSTAAPHLDLCLAAGRGLS